MRRATRPRPGQANGSPTIPQTGTRVRLLAGVGAAALFAAILPTFNGPSLQAQSTVTPPSISVTGGSVCSGGSQTFPVSLTLPPDTVVDKVDVFLLFDDTGSFASFVPTVGTIFSGLVTSLETALPGVSFGFGVGRFEDYGGPGTGFSSETTTGRPFTLNQPIVTAATAGGATARNTLISSALSRSAPGFGGDGPESGLEGLFQAATGAGFDGNGNGSSLESGPAGAIPTQTTPGLSGDVPPFSSNVALTSGSLGGVGWRTDSLRLVLLATDICSVAPHPAGSPVPGSITGAGSSTVPSSALHCSTALGLSSRFGFISDSKTLAGSTVANSVAPSGSGGVQATVSALNALGIQVMGMGPGAAPTTSTAATFSPSTWLSAIARLTGAVDTGGSPLVFSTSVPLATLSTAIQNAITTSTTRPVDITLATTALPAGLSFSFTPSIRSAVPPGGTAAFDVTLTGDGSPISGSFTIQFKDFASGAVLGTIPVTVTCAATLACDIDVDRDVDLDDLALIRAANKTKVPAGSSDPRDANGDRRINVADVRFCTLLCTRPGCAK
jgi:hypothetical protein